MKALYLHYVYSETIVIHYFFRPAMKTTKALTANQASCRINRKHIIPRGMTCILTIILLFGGIGGVMGVAPMLNTIMHTAHDLLLNTCFT